MLNEKKEAGTGVEEKLLHTEADEQDIGSPSGLNIGKPKSKQSFVNKPRSNRIILVVSICLLVVMLFVLFNLGTSTSGTEGQIKRGNEGSLIRELTPEALSSTINTIEKEGVKEDQTQEDRELVLGDDGTLVLSSNQGNTGADTRVIYLQPTEDLQRAKEMFVAGLFSQTSIALAHEPGQDTNRSAGGNNRDGEDAMGIDYTAAYSAGLDAGGMSQNPTNADRNNNFLGSQQEDTTIIDEYVPHTRRHPLERFELKAGTIISAVMMTGINSDLPGTILGQVSENIFDTATGAHLLIPQGSKIIGSYNSHIIFGQQRILVVWSRVIYPDGSSLNIGGMSGSDSAGYSGMKQYVNNHYGRLLASALFSSVFVIAGKVATDNDKNNDGTESTAAEAVMEQMSSFGASLAERNLNLAPTLLIKPGRRFTIITTKDVAFQETYKM